MNDEYEHDVVHEINLENQICSMEEKGQLNFEMEILVEPEIVLSLD